MKSKKFRRDEKRIRGIVFFTFLFSFFVCEACFAQDYVRLKGYYRTYQYTDSVLTHMVDGMMEFYVPIDGIGEFADRKFLGERLLTNGTDETFLPNLEVTPLIRSIEGEEYSQRNNGDVFLMDKPAGHITRSDSLTTITMDELTGRDNHELDMSQLKLVGYDAKMTVFTEAEVYDNDSILKFAGKRMAFTYRQNGDDEWHKADVVSDFYVTDHAVISKKEKRQLMRQKNKIRQFVVPDFVPDILRLP